MRPDILDAIRADGADGITFTSGSSVESFEKLLPAHGLYGSLPALCIGPVTAGVAERTGWQQIVTAPVSTVAGLVETVAATLAE